MRFRNNEAFIFLDAGKCVQPKTVKNLFLSGNFQDTLFDKILNRFEKQKKSLNPEKLNKFFKIQAILLL